METEEELSARKRKADNELVDSLLIKDLFDDDVIERAPALFEQRMKWDEICDTHGESNKFSRHLRMTKESFERLVELIRPALLVDETQAAR
jgi:hypothetical protein